MSPAATPNFRFVPIESSTVDFKDSTLLMPTISTANISQLSIDLIVSSLDLKKVGYVVTPYVLPIAGVNAFTGDIKDGLSTAMEVFQTEDKSLTVVQQRTPIVKGFARQFTNDLMTWIRGCVFSQVIFLSGADATLRIDSQLESTPTLRIFTSEAANKKYANLLSGTHKNETFADIKILEERTAQEPVMSEHGPMQPVKAPGAGILNRIMASCEQDLKDIPIIGFIIFSMEGDNLPDTYAAVDGLVGLLRKVVSPMKAPLSSLKYKPPRSWNGLYGDDRDDVRVLLF
ncbi:PAC2 family-domain-containing protein [Paraphysoderma sedebokerense]|nr:PAC2 family-domain-containing protein [Paraphysoderma sedebokerense]